MVIDTMVFAYALLRVENKHESLVQSLYINLLRFYCY